METLVRERDFQVGFGVPNQIVTPAEIADLFPLARIDDLVGGSYVPDEGRADPVGVAVSLAKGARMECDGSKCHARCCARHPARH
jgi:4-methylaminobutanoate oxidase (formaldehyde-forming)